MKKTLSAAVALTLTLTLSAPALAAEPILISPGPARYGTVLTVNGAVLDTAALPPAPGADSLPLRTVAEADYGFADWYADENRSFFALDGNRVYVDCATGAIEVNGETLAGVKAAFVQGVTYVPASVVDGLEGYAAETHPESNASRIDITTPNGDGLVRLTRDIIDTLDMGASMKQTPEEMEAAYGIPADCFTEAVGFFPMMISADTIIIGRVADGKLEAAKEALEARRAATQQNFEQYLPEPLERAKNGRVVTSGDYIMLIISGDNDAVVQLFQDGVKALHGAAA